MQEIINLRLSEIQEILQSTYLVINLKFLIFAFIRTEIRLFNYRVRHVAYFGHKLGLKFASVLNHSTFEFQDISERATGSYFYVKSTYF